MGNPREAFRTFIRFQLSNAVEEGKINLSPDAIEKIASGAEDDPGFYDMLNDFLAEFVELFGESYGV